jgi:ribosomal protein S18 acetylase RimI-like enzyme
MVWTERRLDKPLLISSREWNQTSRIGWIAVVPCYRRKGFGSKLLKKAEVYAKGRGIRKLYLDTEANNTRALSFYVKNKYITEGLLKDYYKDGSDGILLGKHL